MKERSRGWGLCRMMTGIEFRSRSLPRFPCGTWESGIMAEYLGEGEGKSGAGGKGSRSEETLPTAEREPPRTQDA
jgi:hypothetical protein